MPHIPFPVGSRQYNICNDVRNDALEFYSRMSFRGFWTLVRTLADAQTLGVSKPFLKETLRDAHATANR